MSFSQRSQKKLEGVHPDLVAVVALALEECSIPFEITDGVRTLEYQKSLVAKGASKTMKSRHLTGHAVDVVATPDGNVSWDMEYYRIIAQAIKAAADYLETPIVWGGDWKSFIDGPHFELSSSAYP